MDDDNVEDGSRKYIEDELCFFDAYDGFGPFDENYELNIAYESLSDIEQMVIFLYFKKKYKMNEIAKILNLRDETVTRIKKRALAKIKLFLEGEFDYE